MGLKTEQIVKILQLKELGRAKAFKICSLVGDNVFIDDYDLQEYILDCSSRKLVQKLPLYSKSELQIAFQKGESIMQKSERENIKVVSVFDNDFPESLKSIDKAPIILNFKGNYKELNSRDGIAIIGTREPTKEGVLSGEFFGEYFGRRKFNIVSGLAKGCDSAAHKGCLKGGGMTTAIVAHGLHTIYPKENEKLASEILYKGGVLISEYFIGVGALSNYFVERDRLQAGLSIATIVIQTGVKGGTMHAVNATKDSNKLLAVVKYDPPLNSDKVSGNEMLLRDRRTYCLTSASKVEFLKLLLSIPGAKTKIPLLSDINNVTTVNEGQDSESYKKEQPELKAEPRTTLDADSEESFEPKEYSYVEPPEEVFVEPSDEIFVEPQESTFVEPETGISEVKNKDIVDPKTPVKPIGKRNYKKRKKDKGKDNQEFEF